jgi:hypothetical protein
MRRFRIIHRQIVLQSDLARAHIVMMFSAARTATVASSPLRAVLSRSTWLERYFRHGVPQGLEMRRRSTACACRSIIG